MPSPFRVPAVIAGLLVLAGCQSVAPPVSIPVIGRTVEAAAPVPVSQMAFSIAPITGIPPELVDTLSKALQSEAAARGIRLAAYGDPGATHTLQGYLSAVGGQTGSIVIFVWDVNDSAGARALRISGQENTNARSTDPWADVSETAMRRVARRTIDDLAAWVNRLSTGGPR